MRIQKITILPKYNLNKQSSDNTTKTTTETLNLSFEARVDKGLTRFYEANSDRMPQTVKTYIENLSDKTSQTPLLAQKSAFAAIAGAISISAIQNEFPNEELFSNLKDINESKATRGLLGIYRENKELLNICEQGILKNNENFTIWLLKKIFLETKTIDEINADLEKEINPEFKSMYDSKEKGAQLIQSGTLKALGIKTPEPEYMQSLRYTRSGYSDLVGEKISISSRNFWDSMPLEERTARNKKSVEKFETWWNSMTRNQKLDMIADQMSELEMLEAYNKSEIGKRKKSNTVTATPGLRKDKLCQKGSNSSLSKDDLFKIWAGNNLKLFEASLTEYDKRKISMRREQKRAEWWNSMSPSERTEYINQLKAASEPIRYAMIDAWNKTPDILASLSIAMKKAHIEKPLDAIFGTTSFNQYLSGVMTDFWTNNPDFATRWGTAIQESHQKVKDAVENGRFELLKRDIMKSRSQREKEILLQIKNHKEILSEEEYNIYPIYIQKFIDAYLKASENNIQLLPVEYLKDFFRTASTDLTEEQVESWTKAIKREYLSSADYIRLNDINTTELPNAAIMNRALEAALADILYGCTKDSRVYLLSQADCKMALGQIQKGYPHISIGSLKLQQEFNLPIFNRNIDTAKIEKLYNDYKTRISEFEAESIIDQYFSFDPKNFSNFEEEYNLRDLLKEYIMIYGNSSKIIFSSNTNTPISVQKSFAEKFLNNMPYEIDKSKFNLLVKTTNDFEREKEIYKTYKQLKIKYNFLPERIYNTYFIEISKLLRNFKTVHFDSKMFLTNDKEPKSIKIPRNNLTMATHISFLCAEQAIADKLYEVTNEPKVYALKLEELIEAVERINLIKKFRNDNISIKSELLGEELTLKPQKRAILYKQDEVAQEYNMEILDYATKLTNAKDLDKQELLYILNPDENAQEIDKYTMLRINTI